MRFRMLLVLLVASSMLAPGSAHAAKTCEATLRGGGGDWPTVGGNNHNTNIQPRERSIGPKDVAELKLQWVTTNVLPGQSTPTVQGSCVYAQGGGLLNAIDVRTGELVWRADNDSSCTESDYFQIYCPFGATIVDGRVHVDGAGHGKPFASAYDAATGKRLWKSKRVYFGYDASQLSSPKVAEGVHVTFTTGPDFDPGSRPGFGIFDQATGKALKIRTTNPGDGDYLGGGIWATAAVDKRGYLYVGTSNAEEATADAEYDNSILKIDIRQTRKTFGEILGNYKGDKDWITQSGAFDADFGAGPTLLDVNGRQMLVAMQKSGTFHAVWTDTMTPAWKQTVGVSNVATRLDGNSAMAAYDGKRLYVTANPGVLYAIDPASGQTLWMAPQALEFYTPYRPVVLANGVVYTMRVNNSRLAAWDAETGTLLAEFAPTDRNGNACNSGPSGGLSIAHHRIFINCGTFVAAYGL